MKDRAIQEERQMSSLGYRHTSHRLKCRNQKVLLMRKGRGP